MSAASTPAPLPHGVSGADPRTPARLIPRLGARAVDFAIGPGLVLFPPWALMLFSADARMGLLPLACLLLCDVAALAIWGFQIIRLLKTGQTLGKKWFGVKIVRATPGPLGLANHFVRGMAVNAIPWLCLPFLSLRADRRGFHDLAANTIVIEVGAPS
jgi:uncharacterized RDD family membrane protein YckC